MVMEEDDDNLNIYYIRGELFLTNGEKVSFEISEEGFSQWGLKKEKLGFTEPVLEALSNTFAEQKLEIEEYYDDGEED